MALPTVNKTCRSFKYRLYPNANQTRELETTLETHRRLYNACLEERKIVYETEGRTVTGNEQCVRFTIDRKTNPWYARINATSAQQTVRRLDKAFAGFFRQVKEGGPPGYPRFKGDDHFNSFGFTYGNGVKLIDGRLRIQFIGTIKVKLHRPIDGKIRRVVVSREADRWFVSFLCELVLPVARAKSGPPIGIDMGLEYLLTTSDGNKVPNPRFLKRGLPELRRQQRALARKQRGSNRRKAARKQLQRLHLKIRNQRKDFHWKTAHSLTVNSSYALFVVERLSVKDMLKTRWLARSISDVGWNQFLRVLRYKAQKVGSAYLEVDPRGTSQECSRCGVMVRKTLRQRTHSCSKCGLVLHRDLNAARNILARGLKNLARTGPTKPKQLKIVVVSRSRTA